MPSSSFWPFRPQRTTAAARSTDRGRSNGLSDCSVAGSWRLPNRNELLSLLYNGSGLPLDHPFIEPEETVYYYWSSTTYPYITQLAWTVRIFEDAFEDRGHKGEDLNLVIGVRGGF